MSAARAEHDPKGGLGLEPGGEGPGDKEVEEGGEGAALPDARVVGEGCRGVSVGACCRQGG